MKPQLDTDTVLTIIKMIDKQILGLELAYEQGVDFYDPDFEYPMSDEALSGAQGSLKYLGDHLQKYIDGLLTQAENKSNQ